MRGDLNPSLPPLPIPTIRFRQNCLPESPGFELRLHARESCILALCHQMRPKKILTLLNIIPITCSNSITKLLQSGDKINLYNHFLAFEDSYVMYGNFST